MRISDVSVEQVCKAMRMSEGDLLQAASSMATHYFPTDWRNIDGKMRQIDVPRPTMMTRLGALNAFFLRSISFSNIAYGGLPGCSCFSVARVHCGKKFIITRDVKNCYPSVSTSMLRESLVKVGASLPLADLMAPLLTVHGRIPQGSPTAGIALNLFFLDFDHRLATYCGRHGLACTRFFDDIVMSCHDREVARRAERFLETEIKRMGLIINKRKAKRRGFQVAHTRQVVHGLVVNNKRGAAIAREVSERVSMWAEEYVASARVATPSSLSSLASKRLRLFGHVCHMRQAECNPAQFLIKLLESGDALIERRLRRDGVIQAGARWRRLAGTRSSVANIAEVWRQRKLARRAA